jgi:nucleoside-diphosphate-sugar epimerase
VLTRSEEKAAYLESQRVNAVVGDLLQPDSFLYHLPPQDAVISIARPGFKPGRISSKQFALLQKQTTTYFSTVVQVAENFGCPLVATLGTSFRTSGTQVADEEWPIDRFGIAKLGEYIDPLIFMISHQHTPPLIQILPGEIYGPGGLFRDYMYEWIRTGQYRIIGSGNNYIPRVHVDDCAQAYIHVLEKMPVGEKFIIADDGPCTLKEFTCFMADCMDAPRPKTAPGFLTRLVMGKTLYETITMNCRVSNEKAKNELGWQLNYPTYREGIPAAIEDIEKDNEARRISINTNVNHTSMS